MRKKITKTLVDTLPPGSLVWDTEVQRFAVRRQAEARVYCIKYRHAGRQRWVRIGAHGSPWSPEQARTEALRLLGLVADETDPAAMRGALRGAPTVSEVCDRFLTEHATPKLKARTTAEYRKLITGIIRPKLGAHRVADVTRDDVARLHHLFRATPTHANRLVALLSKLFTLAELWGLRPDGTNPARHVQKFRERRRERYLTAAELGRLGAVFEAADRDQTVTPKPGADPVPVSSWALAALRLLLFTGARSGEILTCQWAYLDPAHACLRLPDSKTGAKLIPLNAPALAVLHSLPRIDGNPYVFPSLARQAGHLVKLYPAWDAIRHAAGLTDVRIHDLRHSYASIGVSDGVSLPIVGRLLGHTVPSTTQRYAHVAPDPVREASELIGARVAAALERR
jgi:integrase